LFLDPNEGFELEAAPFIPVGSRSIADLREEAEADQPRRHGGPP
jgi:hypothetical protein